MILLKISNANVFSIYIIEILTFNFLWRLKKIMTTSLSLFIFCLYFMIFLYLSKTLKVHLYYQDLLFCPKKLRYLHPFGQKNMKARSLYLLFFVVNILIIIEDHSHVVAHWAFGVVLGSNPFDSQVNFYKILNNYHAVMQW